MRLFWMTLWFAPRSFGHGENLNPEILETMKKVVLFCKTRRAK